MSDNQEAKSNEIPELTAADLPPDPLQLSMDLDPAGIQDGSEVEAEVEAEAVEESTESAPEASESPPETEETAEVEAEAEVPFRVSRATAELEERSRQLSAKEAELTANLNSLKPYIEMAQMAQRGERLNILDRMGVSYDQLTDDVAGGAGPTESSRLREDLNALRSEVSSEIQTLRGMEAQRVAYENQQSIADMVSSDDSKYIHVAATSAHNLVQETVEEHFNRTGQVLSHEEAAKAVEEGLTDLFEAALKNPAIRAKYSELLTAATSESPEQTKAEVTPTTLENEDTQDVTRLTDDDFDFTTASDEESIERLANMLKYT